MCHHVVSQLGLHHPPRTPCCLFFRGFATYSRIPPVSWPSTLFPQVSFILSLSPPYCSPCCLTLQNCGVVMHSATPCQVWISASHPGIRSQSFGPYLNMTRSFCLHAVLQSGNSHLMGVDLSKPPPIPCVTEWAACPVGNSGLARRTPQHRDTRNTYRPVS